MACYGDSFTLLLLLFLPSFHSECWPLVSVKLHFLKGIVLEDFELNRNQCPIGDSFGYFCWTSSQIEPWLWQQGFMLIHARTCLLVLMTIHGYWTTKNGLDDTPICCSCFALIQIERSPPRNSLYTATAARLLCSVADSVLRTEHSHSSARQWWVNARANEWKFFWVYS
jgi:hypothetical protein